MPRFTVDFRFIEIERELWALGQFLKWVEPQIQYLRDQDKLRTRVSLEEQGLPWEDPDVQIAYQEIHERAENVFPRFLRGPFVTSLWACYESGVNELADHVAEAKQLDLQLRDVRGNQFLDGARRYFKTVLGFPLDIDDTRLGRLRDLLVVRNVFAHANGQERALPAGKLKHLQSVMVHNTELAFVNGFLVPSATYLSQSFEDVDQSLRALVTLVRGGPALRVVDAGQT